MRVAKAARRRPTRPLPLAAYRDEELARMRRNFYGFDPSYHVARHHFVHRQAARLDATRPASMNAPASA